MGCLYYALLGLEHTTSSTGGFDLDKNNYRMKIPINK